MTALKALSYLGVALWLTASANAYFLMSIGGGITKERLDPIVNPGGVSGHSHIVFGGSGFGRTTSTQRLEDSTCTSTAIKEDNSNYWVPLLYFQWANGSFTAVNGGAVVYYLFPDQPGTTTPFPPDFRMISGTPTLRTRDPNSFAQQAITFLCLDFSGNSGGTTKYDALPDKECPSGIRSQVNFPSCWDGKNVDSPDHKSHVAFRSGGPDSGDCKDPNFPVNIPRIFLEVYWASQDFDQYRSQAMNPNQPFVFSMGDPTGLGYHGDYFNGWDAGVLKKVVDGCNCNIYGDPTCCGNAGIFTLQNSDQCHITPTFDEQITGLLSKLPGSNPVTPAGANAVSVKDTSVPAILSPVYTYTGNTPPGVGTIVTPAVTGGAPPATVAPTPAPTSSATVQPPASSPLPTGASTIPVVVPAPSSSTAVVSSSPGVPQPTVVPAPSSSTTIVGSAPPATVAPAPTGTATIRPPASSPLPTGATAIPSVVPVPSGSTAIVSTSSGVPRPTVVVPAPSNSTTVVGSGPGAPKPTTVPGSPSIPNSSTGASKPTSVIVHPTPVTPTTPGSIPSGTKPATVMVCKKKTTNNLIKARSSKRHHYNRNLQKRYDFEVDDYYQMA